MMRAIGREIVSSLAGPGGQGGCGSLVLAIWLARTANAAMEIGE